MFDMSNLSAPTAGLLVAVAYAALMALAVGPEMTDRMVAKDGWLGRCEAEQRQAVQLRRSAPPAGPDLSTTCGLLEGMSPELGDLCRMVPDPQAAMRQAEAARVAAAIEGIDDVCLAAVERYKAENVLSIALWAGSGRMIVPSSVKNRDVLLSEALRSTGGGAS